MRYQHEQAYLLAKGDVPRPRLPSPMSYLSSTVLVFAIVLAGPTTKDAASSEAPPPAQCPGAWRRLRASLPCARAFSAAPAYRDSLRGRIKASEIPALVQFEFEDLPHLASRAAAAGATMTAASIAITSPPVHVDAQNARCHGHHDRNNESSAAKQSNQRQKI